jgi:cysteine-rich repeat protein
LWQRVGGHAVTVAGVDSQNSLFAISDPDNDAAESGGLGVIRPVPGGHPLHPNDTSIHNIEANASHDIYTVVPSASPGGIWALKNYPGKVNFPTQEWGQPMLTLWPTYFYPCEESMIITEIEAAVIVSPIVCGNSVIDPGETCDPPGQPGPNPLQPGNCLQSCTYCGDGIVNNGEACDDGNGVNNDGCTNNCTLPSCGDGIIGPGETCDPPGGQWPPNGNPCLQSCTYCGDGIVNNGEACDDANVNNNDGCRNNCTLQPDISVDPTSLDFKQVIVGGSSTKTVKVSNTGSGTLTIGTITITGTNANQFSKLNDNCSGKTITPSSSCTVDVKFSPTSTGKKTAALGIPSDDPNENPLNVSLKGKGAKVVVTSPNGGETLRSGSTHIITWQTSGIVGPVAKATLKFYDGTTWKTIANLNDNPGTYPWEVPWVSSHRCKVKVILNNTSGTKVGSDASDSFFDIFF